MDYYLVEDRLLSCLESLSLDGTSLEDICYALEKFAINLKSILNKEFVN